jgi:hypothetical protein
MKRKREDEIKPARHPTDSLVHWEAIGNGVACVVISLSEGELDTDKLHQTTAHPIELGEALEPGAA